MMPAPRLRIGWRAMDDSHRSSAWSAVLTAILAAVACLLCSRAAAEIVIDDFVDPIQIVLPDGRWKSFETSNVGELGATRSVDLYTDTDPNGFVDIDVTEPSTLTAHIPDADDFGFIYLKLDYVLSESMGVDLTEGYTNNAIVFDFRRLTADVPLSASIDAWTTTTSEFSLYGSGLYPIPQSTGPFSLVFPFDSFRFLRGDILSGFDFSYISEIGLTIGSAARAYPGTV
jgi:hypothetical protein